jgi:hypothetical protein
MYEVYPINKVFEIPIPPFSAIVLLYKSVVLYKEKNGCPGPLSECIHCSHDFLTTEKITV